MKGRATYIRGLRLAQTIGSFRSHDRSVLTDRAVIAVSGPEARALSSGADHQRYSQACAGYAALCRPVDAAGQSPVRLSAERTRREPSFSIAPPSSAQSLLKRLTMYRLRAKVELSLRDRSWCVLWNAADGWP